MGMRKSRLAAAVLAAVAATMLTSPVVAAHAATNPEPVAVSVQARGIGVELVRGGDSVSFERLGLDQPAACATSSRVVDGVLQVAVNSTHTGNKTVDFSPQYRNVVRVFIPDLPYQTFSVEAAEAPLHMQDFSGAVQVSGERGSFALEDETVVRGTYQVDISSGSASIRAGTIATELAVTVDSGSLELCFERQPDNLLLDSRGCKRAIRRPAGWGAEYCVGSGEHRITLHNTRGSTAIEVAPAPTAHPMTLHDGARTISRGIARSTVGRLLAQEPEL